MNKNGKTNGQDATWVREGLAYWEGLCKDANKRKHVGVSLALCTESRGWFQKWNAELLEA